MIAEDLLERGLAEAAGEYDVPAGAVDRIRDQLAPLVEREPALVGGACISSVHRATCSWRSGLPPSWCSSPSRSPSAAAARAEPRGRWGLGRISRTRRRHCVNGGRFGGDKSAVHGAVAAPSPGAVQAQGLSETATVPGSAGAAVGSGATSGGSAASSYWDWQ